MNTVWVTYKRPTKKTVPGAHNWSYIGTRMTSVTQEELVAIHLGHTPAVTHIKMIRGHQIYAVNEDLSWSLLDAVVLEVDPYPQLVGAKNRNMRVRLLPDEHGVVRYTDQLLDAANE